MKKLGAGTRLKLLILEKETELRLEGNALKAHCLLSYESLKPVNLLKNTLGESMSEPGVKDNVVNTMIGVTTGFIVKKIFSSKSDTPLTKLTGVILEVLVSGAVTKNAGLIRSAGGYIFKTIFRKKEPHPARPI